MIVAGRHVSDAPEARTPPIRTWMPTEFNCRFSVKLMGRLELAMIAELKAEDASTGRGSGR